MNINRTSSPNGWFALNVPEEEFLSREPVWDSFFCRVGWLSWSPAQTAPLFFSLISPIQFPVTRPSVVWCHQKAFHALSSLTNHTNLVMSTHQHQLQHHSGERFSEVIKRRRDCCSFRLHRWNHLWWNSQLRFGGKWSMHVCVCGWHAHNDTSGGYARDDFHCGPAPFTDCMKCVCNDQVQTRQANPQSHSRPHQTVRHTSRSALTLCPDTVTCIPQPRFDLKWNNLGSQC